MATDPQPPSEDPRERGDESQSSPALQEGRFDTPALTIYGAVTAYCCLFVVFLGLSVWNLPANHGVFFTKWNSHYTDTAQYERLADALIHGRLDLDLPVPEQLRDLENPYDSELRYAIGSKDVPIFWDHAFYDGKYYSYFGVVPALLLYVPVQLLTGQGLDTVLAVIILGVAATIAGALLVWRIRRRWFRATSIPAACLALLALFAGTKIDRLVSTPTFYSVPILCGIACLGLGLWFWIGARERVPGESGTAGSGWRLSPLKLALGSLFLALVLGCRPQLCTSWFLAFPLFWRDVFRDRTLLSRRGLGQSLALLLPFAVVGGLLGWYNAARFGSPFDFGADYNLTGHDMTSYAPEGVFIALEMFLMFLAPFNFSERFPYLTESDNYRDYVGDTLGWAPTEPIYGGYLWSLPATLMAFATPFAWRRLWSKGIASFVPILVGASFVVCSFDVSKAGVSQRYMADFGWALSLAAILVFFALAEGRGWLTTIVTLVFGGLVVLGLFLMVWQLIVPGHWSGIWTWLEPLFQSMGVVP